MREVEGRERVGTEGLSIFTRNSIASISQYTHPNIQENSLQIKHQRRHGSQLILPTSGFMPLFDC